MSDNIMESSIKKVSPIEHLPAAHMINDIDENRLEVGRKWGKRRKDSLSDSINNN